MLRLTHNQYEAMQADAIKRWRNRLENLLRKHAEPARAMSEQDLLALISRQEARAASYGVSTERGLAKWCFMAVMTQEAFDQAPEFTSVLRDPRYGPVDNRLDFLLRSHPAFAEEQDR